MILALVDALYLLLCVAALMAWILLPKGFRRIMKFVPIVGGILLNGLVIYVIANDLLGLNTYVMFDIFLLFIMLLLLIGIIVDAIRYRSDLKGW